MSYIGILYKNGQPIATLSQQESPELVQEIADKTGISYDYILLNTVLLPKSASVVEVD